VRKTVLDGKGRGAQEGGKPPQGGVSVSSMGEMGHTKTGSKFWERNGLKAE